MAFPPSNAASPAPSVNPSKIDPQGLPVPSASQPPVCPHLPAVSHEEILDHNLLRRHGVARDAAFYLDALRYGHYLWLQGHAGRALLALSRALYARVEAQDPCLLRQPLPYAAMAWIMRHHHSDDFPGNPRISFQHQAVRLRGERRELRSARAWGVCSLAAAARPQLSCDDKCPLPGLTEISDLLENHGHPGEAALWHKVLASLA
jgi:hypothetical protein